MRQALFFSKTQPLSGQPIDLVEGPSRVGRVARPLTVRPCSFLRSDARQINGLEMLFLRRKVASDLINKREADSRAARPHRQLVKPAI